MRTFYICEYCSNALGYAIAMMGGHDRDQLNNKLNIQQDVDIFPGRSPW
jgi:hypothetical protein